MKQKWHTPMQMAIGSIHGHPSIHPSIHSQRKRNAKQARNASYARIGVASAGLRLAILSSGRNMPPTYAKKELMSFENMCRQMNKPPSSKDWDLVVWSFKLLMVADAKRCVSFQETTRCVSCREREVRCLLLCLFLFVRFAATKLSKKRRKQTPVIFHVILI